MKAIESTVENYVNGICIDWCEFTVTPEFNDETLAIFDVMQLIGLADVPVIPAYGQNGYKVACEFDKIFFFADGIKPGMGVHVRMSGQGCRNFEKHSKLSFKQLFELIYKSENIKLTRLDVAYDDFEGLIDLDAVKQDVIERNVVTRFRSFNVLLGFQVDHPEVSCTINFGRMASNIWITLYDKLEERKSKDICPGCKHWVRCEIKMRRQNANRFVQLLNEGKNIHELYFLVLNNYVRIVNPDQNDSNRWRWSVADHWAKFCNSVLDDRISLYKAPDDPYTVNNLVRYVTEQAGAAIYTYIKKFSIDDLVEKIAPKQYRLAFKYQELLADPEELPENE